MEVSHVCQRQFLITGCTFQMVTLPRHCPSLSSSGPVFCDKTNLKPAPAKSKYFEKKKIKEWKSSKNTSYQNTILCHILMLFECTFLPPSFFFSFMVWGPHQNTQGILLLALCWGPGLTVLRGPQRISHKLRQAPYSLYYPSLHSPFYLIRHSTANSFLKRDNMIMINF